MMDDGWGMFFTRQKTLGVAFVLGISGHGRVGRLDGWRKEGKEGNGRSPLLFFLFFVLV